MNRKKTFRRLFKSTVFLLALLALTKFLLAKKKFFNYKISKELLDYCSKEGFGKFIFTYTESTSGGSAYYALQANVYHVDGSRMNGSPIKLSKNGIIKTLKNATPDYKDITYTLDSETIKSHGVDLNAKYILSALQVGYDKELYVGYFFDTKDYVPKNTKQLLEAFQASFTPIRINPSPPY